MSEKRMALKRVGTYALGAALTLALGIGLVGMLGRVLYGSMDALPALARGQAVIVEPESRDLGRVPAGSTVETTFDLINLSDRPVVLNGVGASCTCISVTELPLEIPARARQTFRVRLSASADEAGKRVEQPMALYLSSGGPRVGVRVSVKVERASAAL
jgi:hypothetical protein